jgi:hypothetical protein
MSAIAMASPSSCAVLARFAFAAGDIHSTQALGDSQLVLSTVEEGGAASAFFVGVVLPASGWSSDEDDDIVCVGCRRRGCELFVGSQWEYERVVIELVCCD